MPKFRKKPIVIEAERVDLDDDSQLVRLGIKARQMGHGYSDARIEFFIPTLEGEHIVSEGDWIITGIKGERYPCKPDIFEATYEPAE